MIRSSKLYLFSQILNVGFEIITITSILSIVFNLNFKLAIIISCIIGMISIGTNILSWKNNIFYIKDDILYNEKGVFLKRNLKIPLESILAVDVKENFKQRIFKLQTLVIDRGIASTVEDIELVLSKKQAEEFRKVLLSKIIIKNKSESLNEINIDGINSSEISNENIDEKINSKDYLNEEKEIKDEYKASFKDIIIYALTRNQYFEIIGFIFIFYFNFKELDINLIEIFKNLEVINILISGISILIMFKLLSIIITINKYYKFKFTKDNNILDISYGLLNKNKASLDLNSIVQLKINQSLLQKYLKTLTIEVSTLGYGDNINEKAVVFLNISEENLLIIMDSFFSKYKFNDKMFDINPKHKFKYKKQTFGYNEDLIVIESNIVAFKRSIILIDEVDYITIKKNILNKIKNTQNVKISYKGMKSSDLKNIIGIDKIHINNIKKIMLEK